MTPRTDRLTIANLYALLSAVNASAAPIVISLGGLAGAYLLPEYKSLATLPVSGFNIGVALLAAPASWLMFRIGRKHGFMAGALLGFIGVALASWALYLHSFVLFCVALLLAGGANSFVQQYRFAASDYVDAHLKARAISRVLIGGIAAAVIGPQIVMHFRDVLYPTPFAGAFLMGSGLFLIAFLIMQLLPNQPAEYHTHDTTRGRSRREILRQPKFAVALLCGTASYALMAFVMTAAPLAMVGCGFDVSEAALGIQWHVMAMFIPSLFTGNLIARFGHIRVISSGLILLMLCALIALHGLTLVHFYSALILLGIGWNFGFVGATALLTETYTSDEKHKAQGLNDSILFGCVALGSLSSGLAYHVIGWELMNWLVIPIGIVCLSALAWLAIRERDLRADAETHKRF